MPIPTRSAPRPPMNFQPQNNAIRNDIDPFEIASTTQKKIPPPRPPPPKFTKDNVLPWAERRRKPVKHKELLSGLFGRNNQQKQSQTIVGTATSRLPRKDESLDNRTAGTISLIDLSPPGSPTSTTPSSDRVSVDSFGSDGNSNPSLFTSSNTSQTESAFEDDFDFFSNLSTPKPSDPWKINEPPSSTKQIGDTRFFAFNDSTAARNTDCGGVSMPTIIRARPSKPNPPKNLNRNIAPIVTNFNARPVAPSEPSSSTMAWTTKSFDDSPPMPLIPPPAPPQFFLEPTPKPRNTSPHGIALYDFAGEHGDDLSFKQGEAINFTRAINDEWLEGRIDYRTGIFPKNFVEIVVPLPPSSTGSSSSSYSFSTSSSPASYDNIVNALYTFAGETPQDLPFPEGAKITVLSKISDDWLYGEYAGNKGQFPANYVDRVPRDLPQ